MCFLERKMLQIAGEFALYCNLTNWEKGAWEELDTGVLGKVPEEEYPVCNTPPLLLKDSLEFKKTICTKKTARCHHIGFPSVMNGMKAPKHLLPLDETKLTSLWAKRSTDAHWSNAGCLRLGRDRCCQPRPNPHLFISAGRGKVCKHHSSAVTPLYSITALTTGCQKSRARENLGDHFPEWNKPASIKANFHVCSEQFISVWGGQPCKYYSLEKR